MEIECPFGNFRVDFEIEGDNCNFECFDLNDTDPELREMAFVEGFVAGDGGMNYSFPQSEVVAMHARDGEDLAALGAVLQVIRYACLDRLTQPEQMPPEYAIQAAVNGPGWD